MSTTIHETLDELWSTALDPRDKGDKFERLIQAYLKADPEWTAKFSDVWLWSEWPGREGRPDTGIDLVAKRRDTDDLAAIQAKFYDPERTVPKAEIDSFLSASSKVGFVERYIFDTAKAWSKNAGDTLAGQTVPVQRVDIQYLADAQIDWGQFRWETPEVVVPTGPKTLRPHQQRALEDVREGLATHDRGRLIMACGTGKTFTALGIAEDLVGVGGSVLFLVPSIQLLSQSLREWMANTSVDIRPFAVCSDVRVGRKVNTDDADMSTIDLTEPATTDAETLITRWRKGRHAKERMTVVFATYQSIDVVIEAQKRGLPEFDLVICDEAHRTTGVTLSGADESAFVRVHDQNRLRAKKRLYMTATPRVFGEDVHKKAKDTDAVLADMNDESMFGPELHRLGFGDAVEANLLTDYKVVVLAVDEKYVAENFQQTMAQNGEIALDDAAKLIGCWSGLSKNQGRGDLSDPQPLGTNPPMRMAVAFAKDIKSSRAAAQAFPAMVDRALLDVPDGGTALKVEAQHVDGTMGIHERNAHLAWLRAETPDDVCRVLTNARCLSEGVDVPALDAVLFLTPRGSQVDIVQSVGRVMRKSPGKQFGYIILPAVIPSGTPPEEALKDNEKYRTIWQVLQALRSHDDRFHAIINQIELNKQPPPNIVIDTVPPPADVEQIAGGGEQPQYAQLTLEFPAEFRDAMYARIVQKVGERRYWETWAKDVADIAHAHITRINGLLSDPDSPQAKEFDAFLTGLRESLNDSITSDDAVEMLAQHLVTRPVFEALFEEYAFADTNPVARIMEKMLASLDEHPLAAENATLEGFYQSVRRRIAGVDNAEGKQKILIELYDKFFATAFKKTVDKLGIVYTPVEIVDFILRSADDVLRQEFGQGLTDEGVHILDPFTGTGSFLVRLLQSGLIKPHDLARKYANEIHANEILLLAYYIATVNIETTYAYLAGEQKEFPGLVLTDTFQSWEPDDTPDLGIFVENNERLQRLKKLPITVIIGNPPYSSGQDSANDDNANEKYPSLDEEIRKTYAERSTATLKNSLYDSYIRAIKWATLRIGERGLIAYVTNGGFLDSNTADGMRKALVEEFSSIYVYNLRGNQRTAGEQSRKEGGKVFGGGSRATVAITLLVKDPNNTGPATIHYTDIGDYLTAEQKLSKVADVGSVFDLHTTRITPNEHGDWLNQRRDDFTRFMPISSEGKDTALFDSRSRGLETGRDAWVYNFGSERLQASMRLACETYSEVLRGEDTNDERRIKWTDSLRSILSKRTELAFVSEAPRSAIYRPFQRVRLYPDTMWYHRPKVARDVFPPRQGAANVGLYVLGPGATAKFAVLAIDAVPDIQALGAGQNGQVLPRWRYEKVEDSEMLDLGGVGGVVDGYRRVDNITDETLKRFRAAYGSTISKDSVFFYVYGLLHSPEYRETYAADLKKMLPRIPLIADFTGYADAGRKLSELHLGYETVDPYPLDGLAAQPPTWIDPYDYYAVGDKKMRFGGKGRDKDRSVIHYNDHITLTGIPDEAYRYQLGSRSAIEWMVDRYWIKTDKPSGIVNNPNHWSREVGDPRYIIDLLARIVTVSLETMKIVDNLPPLDIINESGVA
ncbi:DEAD/DEAH box helicase [Georgenia alba]|uniref:DEAD/DEAH box helicase n=1 Tax=Georgenia alba TaxID=2233858 RepID=A0ABW2Q5N9_9MICO